MAASYVRTQEDNLMASQRRSISTSAGMPGVPKRVSRRLRRFVRDCSHEHRSIFEFVQSAAASLPASTRVLDAGAGDTPYRELFEHCTYITADFAATHYHKFRKINVVCDLASLPIRDQAFDTVVNTQVLEHVPEPGRVLAEFRRVLTPGGQLFLTVPLIWEVHEHPYDFYRFTPYSINRLLVNAGFQVEYIRPRCGRFRVMAALFDLMAYTMPPFPGGLVGFIIRAGLSRFIRTFISPLFALLDPLDKVQDCTLGYACHALVPVDVPT